MRLYIVYAYIQWVVHAHFSRIGGTGIASQARLFRAVAELTARESHEEEELLPELLQREKSLVAFENVIVTCKYASASLASHFCFSVSKVRANRRLINLHVHVHVFPH